MNLCLTTTYFQYNGKHYKQLHGTAMGYPVSVVDEIVMQNIEEQVLETAVKHYPSAYVTLTIHSLSVHKHMQNRRIPRTLKHTELQHPVYQGDRGER